MEELHPLVVSQQEQGLGMQEHQRQVLVLLVERQMEGELLELETIYYLPISSSLPLRHL